ncbi:hypothetical protein GALMADRAFT_268684 [Galerina marginata CBS 339.88]|uniref:Uncharacterized protein n=1 Tax=Galerina marginata (strain CBS 339.88) TaxID=685588 RepID=A0A067SW20_GALM3|nr:hypothetical protein GALMADRAFT_268684 [Galerina marginata CBS 339.88]
MGQSSLPGPILTDIRPRSYNFNLDVTHLPVKRYQAENIPFYYRTPIHMESNCYLGPCCLSSLCGCRNVCTFPPTANCSSHTHFSIVSVTERSCHHLPAPILSTSATSATNGGPRFAITCPPSFPSSVNWRLASLQPTHHSTSWNFIPRIIITCLS